MLIYLTNLSTSFYQALQASPELDFPEQCGKVHNLALILLGLILSLLCGNFGSLSGILRGMQHTHSTLCTFLAIYVFPVVSLAHLPLTHKVNLTVFKD